MRDQRGLKAAGADERPDSSERSDDEVTVRRIADGVWMHTSWKTFDGGVRFLSNGLIVEHEGGLLLVDTAWGVEPTERLLDWIAENLRLPVTNAVVTHFHDDRLGGGSVLRGRGIPTVASALTIELAEEDPAISGARAVSVAELAEGYRLDGVEVRFPGAAHSRDNLVVWLPDRKVLFGGCAVRPMEMTGLGNTADADVEAWPRSIERLVEVYPDASIVVPSHGAPGGPELLTHTLAQFSDR